LPKDIDIASKMSRQKPNPQQQIFALLE